MLLTFQRFSGSYRLRRSPRHDLMQGASGASLNSVMQ
jgi:hypothetical protein